MKGLPLQEQFLPLTPTSALGQPGSTVPTSPHSTGTTTLLALHTTSMRSLRGAPAQEGDTLRGQLLSYEGRCGGAVPVCRAAWPHVGKHQWPGLVPVFMGSPCNQSRKAVSHQRFESLSESTEKETFITQQLTQPASKITALD